MTKEQLEYLLKDERMSVKFSADGKEYSAEPQICISVDENFSDMNVSVSGYELTSDGQKSVFKTFEELYGNFGDKQLWIISINGDYESLEAYEEEKAFANIDMKKLLEIYLPIADSFSLTCPYNSGFDREHPYGVYGIDSGLSEKALDELAEIEKKNSERQFAAIPQKERDRLPPFEKVYEDIKAECAAYRKRKRKQIEKYDGNAFFCDVFASGKGKYRSPQGLWHIYHAVDTVETCRYQLEKMSGNTAQRPLTAELDAARYGEIRPYLIKTDVTFSWHCTTSGQLAKVFHFGLNEKTAAWLSRHKNDYDFKELDDLAFYADGECVFSSCTHERFHTAIRKK